jgi:hypothetical protein
VVKDHGRGVTQTNKLKALTNINLTTYVISKNIFNPWSLNPVKPQLSLAV